MLQRFRNWITTVFAPAVPVEVFAQEKVASIMASADSMTLRSENQFLAEEVRSLQRQLLARRAEADNLTRRVETLRDKLTSCALDNHNLKQAMEGE